MKKNRKKSCTKKSCSKMLAICLNAIILEHVQWNWFALRPTNSCVHWRFCIGSLNCRWNGSGWRHSCLEIHTSGYVLNKSITFFVHYWHLRLPHGVRTHSETMKKLDETRTFIAIFVVRTSSSLRIRVLSFHEMGRLLRWAMQDIFSVICLCDVLFFFVPWIQ
jgi:hypothetical protein